MHVIVAGAGVGGLSAALALARRGASVTLLEQSSAIGEAGAGVQVGPNATRILAGWGLESQLRRVAFRPEAVEVREHAAGRLLLRTPLGDHAEQRWAAPYLQLHRADLIALLLEALQACAAVELRLGERLLGVDQSLARVSARLGSGAALQGDALIGCDGIHSSVRAALGPEAPARFTGHVAWRGTVAMEALTAGLIAPVAAVWTGSRRHFVHYPIRRGTLVNFLGVVEQRAWTEESWTQPGDPAELAAAFAGWPDSVVALTGAVSRTWRWGLFDRAPMARWSHGRVSLLGDAAHPMAPFLAQGAAMAIEDAEVLARLLAQAADVPAALLTFERLRRPRTARVQGWSRRNGRLFHLPAPLSAAAFAVGRRLAAGQLDWLYGFDPSA